MSMVVPVCRWLLLLLVTVIPWASLHLVVASNQRLIATIPGDIMIGALFPVHHTPGPRQAQTRTCGQIREQYGIQRVEAAFQMVDDINQDNKLLPNITLGIEIRDTCWYSPIALEQSIEFIRDAIAMNEEANLDSSLPRSTPNPTCPKPKKGVKNLVGVIGPASSTVTIQVQNLLQLFSIPQVGYSATSRDLSDKSFYKYFLRVVPSDLYQAQVMVDIVKTHNWTYISAVHTDGNYGGSGMEAFIKAAQENGICIATTDSVLSNADEKAFEDIIRNLQKFPKARVVACFCEGMTIRGLLKASKKLNATGQFLFIGSDGWSDRHDVVRSVEEQAAGGISVRIFSPYVKNFDEYYFNLNPFTNTRNPWFKEFWEVKFNCSFESSKFNRTCTGRERLRHEYKQDTKMAFVKKAILTMAHGLHNMQRFLCPDSSGLCPNMLPINGSVFLQFLVNASFRWQDEFVKFDANGDPPGRYDIMNFQKLGDNDYEYVHVGSWISGNLTLFRPIKWHPNMTEVPESVCSKPCPKGMVKNIQSESVKCCWFCVECKENEYVLNETTCKACPLGWWPNENLTGCFQITVEYLQFSNTSSIVAMTIACLGFTATVFTMAVFIKYNDTPVVKASTRELSYIILVGMYLCHGTTFVLIAQPTKTSCFITRILPGLSFALMYAALVTKTNRIARILAGSKKKIITKKPRFMSSTAQVVITWLLISIESGIIAAMLVFEPADSMLVYPKLNRVVLVCNTTPLGIIAPLGFDLFLIAMCTVYAIKTRNVPENFNEAKFIGFTMYTTLVIWIAFVPIYFGSDSKVITLCLCISFSAIVALVLLFAPKLYIILFRPEKNNRSAFTTAKNVRCHIGYMPSGVSRHSSHSTSDFSLESPRNHSLEVVKTKKDSDNSRRHSLNIFERFRVSKQDKIAASVAQHIRAVRAAEALDRQTRPRRTGSFRLHDAPPSATPKLPAQRSTSSGEDSPGSQEKHRLVGMIKQSFGNETERVPGFDILEDSMRQCQMRDEAACQTTDDLLEAWLPTLRKRIVRSETLMSTLTPDDDYDTKRVLLETATRTTADRRTVPSVNLAFQELVGKQPNGTKPRVTLYSDAEIKDRSDAMVTTRHDDDDDVDAISLQDVGQQQRRKASQDVASMPRPSSFDQMLSLSPTGEGLEAVDDQDSQLRAGYSGHMSEESLLDATSSIVEESASSGSEGSPGSGIYKNIIISLGSPRTPMPPPPTFRWHEMDFKSPHLRPPARHQAERSAGAVPSEVLRIDDEKGASKTKDK